MVERTTAGPREGQVGHLDGLLRVLASHTPGEMGSRREKESENDQRVQVCVTEREREERKENGERSTAARILCI